MKTHKLTLTVLAALCLLASALALNTAAADAGYIHRYLSQITEVPAEPGLTSGPFQGPGRLEGANILATDGGDLYVEDPGKAVIDKYGPAGEFLAQISTLAGPAYNLAGGIAINHTTGEIYFGNVARITINGHEAEGHTVDVFANSGEYLATWSGADTPTGAFGQSSPSPGVAADNSTNPSDPAAGSLYVATSEVEEDAFFQSFVDVFKPEAGGREKYLTRLATPSDGANYNVSGAIGVAVDEVTGDVIVSHGARGFNAVYVYRPKTATEYELLFHLTGPPGKLFEAGGASGEELILTGLAADGANGDIYVADGARKAVYEFTPTGEFLGEVTGTSSGPFSEVTGVAVGSTGSGSPGTLYVADAGAHAVDVFTPDVPVPDVTTGVVSGVGNAKFAGTVNPSGTPITSCRFEYGLTTGYGSSLPCAQSPGSGSAPVAVSANVDLGALSPGATYHYRLAATDEEGETVYGKDETAFTPPAVAGSALASGVTSFAATLTGVLEPGGFTPEYHFVYGLTSAYGSSWPVPDATAGSGSQQAVAQTLTGLQPDTTYHFALVATNFGGFQSVGPDRTFTTRPLVPPAVGTGGAGAIGQTAATLTGSVDPEGLATTYRFEYGAGTGYGSTWPVVQVFAGSGATGQEVAVAVPNLTPGATYHYRLVASNEDGTTYGADGTFVTQGYPVSSVQEPPVFTAQLGFVAPERSHPVHRHVKGKGKKVKRRGKREAKVRPRGRKRG